MIIRPTNKLWRIYNVHFINHPLAGRDISWWHQL